MRFLNHRSSASALASGILGLSAAGFLAYAETRADGLGDEVGFKPHGAIPDAGWALARLNQGGSLGIPTAAVAYTYPDTTAEIRLYLIDTAVDNSSGWFDANPKLTLAGTTLFGTRPAGVFPQPEHGTKLLSLVAGPQTGAALGANIEVLNYDIYPDGPSYTSLSSAVIRASSHHVATDTVKMPAVILIASGSDAAVPNTGLQTFLTTAVSRGITVVVSAGNENTELNVDPAHPNYLIPGAFGTNEGIICVGASTSMNTRLPSSNFGAAVDLSAPGDQVRTIRYPNPAAGQFGTMSGTSPAAALVAAAAIVELSKDPTLTPAQVEAALKGGVFPAPVSLVQVAPPDDADGDGVDDALEIAFGFGPFDANDTAKPPVLTVGAGTASLSFELNAALFNPANPQVLGDGSTWKVRCSTTLSGWEDAEGTMAVGSPINGRYPVVFTVPTTAPKCFLLIEVTPPGVPGS